MDVNGSVFTVVILTPQYRARIYNHHVLPQLWKRAYCVQADTVTDIYIARDHMTI